MIPSISLNDRRRGVLIGTVVGDAFGNPLEGAPASALIAQLRRRTQHPGPWRYTDDGAMTIALAESLREAGTIDPVHLLTRFRAHYEPARGFGRGMKRALSALERGSHWADIAFTAWPEGSRGNGGAVRVGVVALRPWLDVPSLRSAARLATRVTHAHDDAIAAALVQVTLVDLVLREPALLDSPAELLQHAALLADDCPCAVSLIEKVKKAVAQQLSPTEIARSFGTSTLAVESVPAALASFLLYHSTFEDAVLQAASLGGDVDSICALVGCLAGALHGYSAIPALWIDALATETPSVQAFCALADDLGSLAPACFNDVAA
ncbi:ADP-ribosylglycohydrolase family protein [Sorangium sp. So ce145]|uniref:ADP-ribosylglycohydrolase family protein n=1 Tax=Sorangium sp. So ce145 TaxID=3133285 RepID=UPI003F60BA55